jgi:hypothetical protein
MGTILFYSLALAVFAGAAILADAAAMLFGGIDPWEFC